MAKRGENIYLRKDGRWEGRYIKGRKENGKALFGSIYGTKYREVKRRLVVIKAQLSENPQPVLAYRRGTLADWLDYWLNEMIRPDIRNTTYDSYLQKINTHILPLLGEYSICGITKEDIVRFMEKLEQRVAQGTAQSVCRILKAAFAAARKKKLIAESPFEDMKCLARQRKKPRFLLPGEQKRIEHDCMRTGKIEYIVALYTGLRLGELCALKWEDVDFEHNVIYVRHTLSRVYRRQPGNKTVVLLSPPKSECSVRDIPVPVFVMRLLFAHFERSESVFVFAGKRGHMDPRTMQRQFSCMAARLGIKGAHMHTLRHTFATRCLEQQIGCEVLSELLGHSSPEVTYRFYAHCTLAHKRECIGRLQMWEDTSQVA